MNIEDFDENITQFLENLSEASEKEVNTTLKNLNQESISKIVNYINKESPLLKSKDLEFLNKIDNRVFLSKIVDDEIVDKIDLLRVQISGELNTLFSLSPLDEQTALIQLTQKIQNSTHKGAVIRVLRAIPASQRTLKSVHALIGLFNNITDTNQLVQTILKLPAEHISLEIQLTHLLTSKCKDGDSKSAVLLEMHSIQEDTDKMRLALELVPIINKISDGYAISSILQTFISIPQAEREGVIQLSLPLMKGLTDGFQIHAILQTVFNIPAKERTAVIQDASPIMHQVSDGFRKSSILKGVASLPSAKRPVVIAQVIPLAQTRGAFSVGLVLQEISIVPETEVEIVIQCLLLLAKIVPAAQDLVSNTRLILSIPQDKRLSVIEAWSVLIQQTHSIEAKLAMLELIPLFPVEQHNTVIALLKDAQNIDMSMSGMIEHILDTKPELMHHFHTHLIQRLGVLTDSDQVLNLAQLIYQNPQVFQISENDPLYQQASHYILMADATDNLKNPYAVYKKLQSLSKEPPPVVDLQAEEVAGQKVVINPKKFRENGEAQEPVLIEQLPAVNPNSLELCFKKIEQRLTPELLHHIEMITESSFQDLQANFIQHAYLESLLNTPRHNPKAPSPLDAAHFLAIANYIQSLSDEIQDGFLSPKEEVLLKMSASIQNCKAGKEFGIHNAYDTLPNEYRYEKKHFGGAERVFAYLDDVVQMQLNAALSGTGHMMHEFIGTDQPIAQLSHQTLYLKNLIGSIIGLRHSLKFDPHTEMVYDDLLKKSPAEVCQIFYKHFTPSVLVKSLQKRINRDLQIKGSGGQLFKELNSFLGQKDELLHWELTDDDSSFILTEQGARNLLLAAGYLASG